MTKTLKSRPVKKYRRRLLTCMLLGARLGCVDTLHGETGNSGSLWLPYLMQNDGVLPTYGTSVAVDRDGAVHAAYCIYTGADQGNRPAIYAYCRTNFGERANWTFIALGQNVSDARVTLDPQGRPRLMLFGPAGDPQTPERMRYQYAQCNAGWTNVANWTLTTIATPIETVVTRENDNNHYFAISPQGTVAFIHTEKLDYYTEVPVYVSCSGDATAANNWTSTQLFSSYIDQPSIAFSPDGHPRLVFGLFQGGDLYLAYAQCDGDSTDANQWTGVVLSQIHGSANYSLKTDAAGRPRIAFASGSYAAPPFVDHELYYLWCTSGSITDPANWQFDELGLSVAAGGVDLALDGMGRPRISYLAWEGAHGSATTPSTHGTARTWIRLMQAATSKT